MKKSRYTEEQIVGFLKEGEAGMSVSDLCRKHGMSDATYYNWKAKYGGMAISDVRRLKALEDENRRLKHLVAYLTLDNQALKAVKTFGSSGLVWVIWGIREERSKHFEAEILFVPDAVGPSLNDPYLVV